MSEKKRSGLRIIGILKLVSAALLLILVFGIFNLLGKNLGRLLEHYVRILHIDMENKHITNMLAKASGISATALKNAGIVTLIYALLFIIEGIGLLKKKRWAEYLTIIITGALVPLEIYEIARRLSIQRISILIINLAIIGYLIYRLRSDRHSRHDDLYSP